MNIVFKFHLITLLKKLDLEWGLRRKLLAWSLEVDVKWRYQAPSPSSCYPDDRLTSPRHLHSIISGCRLQ